MATGTFYSRFLVHKNPKNAHENAQKISKDLELSMPTVSMERILVAKMWLC